jgi:hypothetical protein
MNMLDVVIMWVSGFPHRETTAYAVGRKGILVPTDSAHDKRAYNFTTEYTMADKTVHTVKTKLNKDDKSPVITSLTIDWTGATAELLRAPAADSLIINWQGQQRRGKKIPAQATLMASEFIARMGARMGPVTVESTAAMAATMTPEQVNALIKKLQDDERARVAAEKAAAKPTPEASKNKGFRTPPKGGDGGTPAST